MPVGVSDRVGRVKAWRKVSGPRVFIFFHLCPQRSGGCSCCHTAAAPGAGGAFDDALETPGWGAVSRGLPGLVSIVVRCCLLCCTRVRKSFRGLLAEQVHLRACTGPGTCGKAGQETRPGEPSTLLCLPSSGRTHDVHPDTPSTAQTSAAEEAPDTCFKTTRPVIGPGFSL